MRLGDPSPCLTVKTLGTGLTGGKLQTLMENLGMSNPVLHNILVFRADIFSQDNLFY